MKGVKGLGLSRSVDEEEEGMDKTTLLPEITEVNATIISKAFALMI